MAEELTEPVLNIVPIEIDKSSIAPTDDVNTDPPAGNDKPAGDENKGTDAPAPKMWDDEFKTHFPDFESVDLVKSSLTEYKTKAEKALELEAEVTKLKAETEKFNKYPKLKTYADLLDNGKDFDENTLAFLNKDFSKVENPMDLLAAKMKDENPKWTDKEIALELKTKYRLNEFQQKLNEYDEPIELTPEQLEIKEVMEGRIKRDAEEAGAELTKKQEEFKLIKTPTPQEIENSKKADEIKKLEWEKANKEVQEKLKVISSKVDKIKVEFPKETQDEFQKLMGGAKDKIEPYEFAIDEKDKVIASEILSSIGSDLNKFWGLFGEKDANGYLKQWDDAVMAKVYDVILHITAGAKKEQKLAVNQFKAGLEYAVKNDNKVNFTPNNTQASQGNKGVLKIVKNTQGG